GRALRQPRRLRRAGQAGADPPRGPGAVGGDGAHRPGAPARGRGLRHREPRPGGRAPAGGGFERGGGRRVASPAMPTVLVASDAPWVRDKVKTALCGPGFEVIEVERGRDVRQVVGDQNPDLVVVDLQIANM